ncbi:hypothetical protein KAU11_10655 [Candidatus Babeliales bacterium]|nr:hypothetical protein [Candidatus Babeliales bacterium]
MKKLEDYTIDLFLELKKERAIRLGNEAYKDLAERVLSSWVNDLPFSIYMVNIIYPDHEGNTIKETVFERAKTSAEAVRLVADRKLPPTDILDLEKDCPYEDYGILDVRKFDGELIWTTKDIEKIIDYILMNYYSEQWINNSLIRRDNNATEIMQMLKAVFKFKSRKLESKYRRVERTGKRKI